MSGENNKVALYEPVSQDLECRRPKLLQPYHADEAEEELDLRAYWHTIQKRRWTIVSIVVAVFTVALIATFRQKPVYRATALLEIQQENQNVPTLQELFQLESVSDNYLETQYKILQSDTLARRVIADLRLDQVKEFGGGNVRRASDNNGPGGNGQSPSITAAAGQSILQAFGSRLSVEPVPRSRLVRVSFESQDAELAAKAVNTLAANYIQENLEDRWNATQKASEWLTQQLQGFKAKLENSEDDLQQYAQANGLLYLESEKGETENIVNERLRELQDELTKAQANRYDKESLHRLVTAGNYGSLPGDADSKVIQDLTARLADLERGKAELTSSFSETYPKVREVQNQIDRLQQLLTEEQKRAAERITNEYLAATRREALIAQAFDEQRSQANVVAGRSVQYNILKREVDTNKQLYEGLLQRLKEAGVSAGLKASNIRVVDAAVPPLGPVRPRVGFNLAVWFVMGLACAVSLAFLQEHLDNTLKTADDVEQFLRVPALALIPSGTSPDRRKNGYGALPIPVLAAGKNGNGKALQSANGKGWFRVDAETMPHGTLSEAFRGLRTSVLLSTAGRPPRSLVFVSAEPSEGKTTTCCNLAISLAQLGKRVLVIDADMRRPNVHRFFGVSSSAGIVNYLTGDRDWPSLTQVSGLPELECLVCGPVPPNPSEIISSERMQTLLLEAMGKYDFVFVDSPPLLSVSDGRILTTMVEGTILVVKGGATPREAVRHAQVLASDVGARLIGVVLNDVNRRSDDYYYSRNYYRSYSEASPERQ